MHKTFATGNIGKDAVIKNLTDGSVINFNVAVNKKIKNAQGVEVETTMWYSCGLYRRPDQSTAIAQYLKAGVKVLVEGEPSVRLYQDKDNKTQYSLDLRVNQVELLSPKPAEAEPRALPANSFGDANLNADGKQGLPASNFDNEAPAATQKPAAKKAAATA